MTTNQLGNSIDIGNAEEFLQSATNALQHGQRQFLTPRTLASACATMLAPVRHVAVDLNMGRGDLLATTGCDHLLGLDIHRAIARKPSGAIGEWHSLWGDVTHWYELAHNVGFRGDLFTLNPPFGLKWHAERLSQLAHSRVPAVSEWWLENIVAKRADTVDSTIASLMIALDRCGSNGEGYLICNEETAIRFLGDPSGDATSDLRRHVWAWLTIPFNIWENQGRQFNTCVLFFSKSHAEHAAGRPPFHITAESAEMEDLHDQLQPVALQSSALCAGSRVTRGFHATDTALANWEAIADEYRARHHPNGKHSYNVFLKDTGAIGCYLSVFDRSSGTASNVQLAHLHSIRDQYPAQLVVQNTERQALISAVKGDVFRVEPAVLEIVEKALSEYERQRDPFFTPTPFNRSPIWMKKTALHASARLPDSYRGRDIHWKP